jgi:hypothetical protein
LGCNELEGIGMVKEIEYPYCHAKVVPKHRFSSTTFNILLVLGIIPFILYLIGCAMLYNSISPLLGLLGMMPTSPTYPGQPDPRMVINALTGMFTSFEIMAVAGVVLYLIIGIIPAIIYWAFRHDTYACPSCEMEI